MSFHFEYQLTDFQKLAIKIALPSPSPISMLLQRRLLGYGSISSEGRITNGCLRNHLSEANAAVWEESSASPLNLILRCSTPNKKTARAKGS